MLDEMADALDSAQGLDEGQGGGEAGSPGSAAQSPLGEVDGAEVAGIVAVGPEFVARLTACQSSLLAYICAMIGGSDHANDVLQETNVAIWRKADTYDASRPFEPWAFSFALNKVREYRRAARRDRLVFDDDLLVNIQTEAEVLALDVHERIEALDGCIKRLPRGQRDFIRHRYEHGRSVAEMAELSGRSPGAVSALLYRARRAILECLDRAMRREAKE